MRGASVRRDQTPRVSVLLCARISVIPESAWHGRVGPRFGVSIACCSFEFKNHTDINNRNIYSYELRIIAFTDSTELETVGFSHFSDQRSNGAGVKTLNGARAARGDLLSC